MPRLKQQDKAEHKLRVRADNISERDAQKVLDKADRIEKKFSPSGPPGRFVNDGKLMVSMVDKHSLSGILSFRSHVCCCTFIPNEYIQGVHMSILSTLKGLCPLVASDAGETYRGRVGSEKWDKYELRTGSAQ